jgi:hypothetical protein
MAGEMPTSQISSTIHTSESPEHPASPSHTVTSSSSSSPEVGYPPLYCYILTPSTGTQTSKESDYIGQYLAESGQAEAILSFTYHTRHLLMGEHTSSRISYHHHQKMADLEKYNMQKTAHDVEDFTTALCHMLNAVRSRGLVKDLERFMHGVGMPQPDEVSWSYFSFRVITYPVDIDWPISPA